MRNPIAAGRPEESKDSISDLEKRKRPRGDDMGGKQFMPADTEGLLFVLPLVEDDEPVYEGGEHKREADE